MTLDTALQQRYMNSNEEQCEAIDAYIQDRPEPFRTRMLNLYEACQTWGVVPGDFSYSGGEDIAEFLPYWDAEEDRLVVPEDGGEDQPALCEWAAVTGSGEHKYIYPSYDTRSAAAERTVEHMDDDIYAEYPTRVINLDTNETFKPDFSCIAWVKVA